MEIQVPLPDAIETHSGYVKTATLKQPTARMFMELAEPQQWVTGDNGSVTLLDRNDIIASYLDRCIQQPLDPILIASTTLANAMALREGVLSFFAKAREQMLAARLSSSASTSDGSAPAASAS